MPFYRKENSDIIGTSEEDFMNIIKRKKEHINIIRFEDTSSCIKTGFDDIQLLPKTLPELDLSKISIETSFLGKKLSAPIIISSMTGGTHEAAEINARLARAAQKFNIAMSVGSQKAMINSLNLAYTYEVRNYAPDILLIGNIGIDYLLSKDFDINKLKLSLEQLKADALYIHINALQEIAQPEGIENFKGAFTKIRQVCKTLNFPVLIKEVGNGIDPNTAEHLQKMGVNIIDIAGGGGTSWAAVEGYRGSVTGEAFRNWGIPTCASLILCKKAIDIPVIASGGVRTGQDIIKSIVLGAKLAGIAKPLFLAAVKNQKTLDLEIERIISEIKTTMLLVGAKNLNELKKTRHVISGELKNYLDQTNLLN